MGEIPASLLLMEKGFMQVSQHNGIQHLNHHLLRSQDHAQSRGTFLRYLEGGNGALLDTGTFATSHTCSPLNCEGMLGKLSAP